MAGSASTAAAPVPIDGFIDGLVTGYMTRIGIAGVIVAVVDRDHDLLVRGYGDASLAPERKVDATDTLFRIASISKTFTYVAAMQLVEAGKLDLDADANRYLPAALQLSNVGYPPVRVRDLMTHSAGFEDTALGHLLVRKPGQVLPLAAYLARYRPRRVRAPGAHADYSNYGAALLGEIVANVSGEAFESYVDHHLLAPLQMRHTTFREPLAPGDPRGVDAAMAATFSVGFMHESDGFTARPFSYSGHMAPAGAGSSSGADMARWMRMLLNRGTLDGATVLAPGTFGTLASMDFRNAPSVGAIAHGFFRNRYGRYQSLEHAGNLLYFHSNIVLLLDAGIGVFVSTNTDAGRALATDLPRLVIERLLPDARAPTPPAPAPDFAKSVQRYTGHYLGERRNYSTLEKLLTASIATVTTTAGGYLVVDEDGQSHRYVADGKDSFRAVNDGTHLAFLANANGMVTGLASPYGHTIADRVGPFGNPRTLAMLLGAIGLLSLLVLTGAWHRSRLSVRIRAHDGRGAAFTLDVASVAWLLFLAIAVFVVATMDEDALVFDYPNLPIRVGVIAAYVAAAASAFALLAVPSALRARGWSIGRKLRYLLVVLTMLAALIVMGYWKILFAPLSIG